MESGFSKNVDLLNETYRVDDLLDFSASISDFQKYLSRIHKHSLVGIVGDFGSGKSTMLYQLEKSCPEQWVVFDAWAFPNRKDLWEGFVLDFARKLSPKEFEKARREINGESKDDIKSLVSVFAEGANLFVPGAGIVKNFSSLFKSSPARRVFEFKEMLLKLVEKRDKNTFVVLEDIDRSGEEGAIFLETLKQFIEDSLDNSSAHKMTFIIPMGTKNYDGGCADSYRKSLDYTYRFKPKINFEKFIDKVFVEGLFVKNSDHWREQLDQLFQYFVRSKTVRDLKKILREANHVFLSKKNIDNFIPDPRMVVMMEIFYESGNHIAHLSKSRDTRTIPALSSQENIYSLFCLAICDNTKVSALQHNGGRRSPEIVFQQDHSMVIPQHWQDFFDEEKYYRLQVSDLYLR